MIFSAIIFDLDGTLVDSRQGILMALQEACHSIDGKARSFDTSLIGPPVKDMLKQAVPSFSDKNLDAATAKFRSIYDDYGWSGYRLYSNVTDTIEKIASIGIPMHIATYKPKIPTSKICHDTGLDIYMNSIRAFNDRKNVSKEELLYDFRSQNALYVGDTKSDYEIACALNIDYAHCNYGFGHANNYNYLLQDFSDLLEII